MHTGTGRLGRLFGGDTGGISLGALDGDVLGELEAFLTW